MKAILHLLCLLIIFSATAQNAVDNRKQDVIFQSVNVVPMDSETVLQNQTVVVRNGRIVSITAGGKIAPGNKSIVIDGKGKYLIPGLAEMHAHVPPNDDMESMKEVSLLFALKGVTMMRGMLGHPRHIELRSMLQKGEIVGPRFYTSGPSFSGNSVKTPEAAAELVRQQKQAGYDFLKLHPGLTKETFAAMVKTAKEVNIPFAGHVSYDVGVWRAIDAGYATIDHLDGFVESLVPGIENLPEQENGIFGMLSSARADTTKIPKLMAALREKNIWVVPTQALAERWFAPDKSPESLAAEPEMKYMAPSTITGWTNSKKSLMSNPSFDAAAVNRFIQLRRKLIYECNKNGVGLLLGSDAPQVFDVPGFSIHHELQYMVDAGLTPYQALKTGTANVGTFYKQKDLGTIKAGSVSDLVLLSGNPLTDISQTKNIQGVMVGNYWLSKDYIDAELKKLEKK
jgi:imidazolonepropionase-like amidohydrolase